MKSMQNENAKHLADNLSALRKRKRLSQEEVAEQIGVTRQAVAKWENGDSMPDLLNCDALAQLYDVSLDDLLHYDERSDGLGIAPRGKHLFGTVKVGERGQIVLPKKARDTFGLKHGDLLVVLGDTNHGSAGIALIPGDMFVQLSEYTMDVLGKEQEE